MGDSENPSTSSLVSSSPLTTISEEETLSQILNSENPSSQSAQPQETTITTSSTTTTGCVCPITTITSTGATGETLSSTTTTSDISSSEDPQVTQATGTVLPSGECYCGSKEEIEEAESTTDMPMINDRDMIVDKFDEEIVRKINLIINTNTNSLKNATLSFMQCKNAQI